MAGSWHDDPRGRYQKRWYDGENWTAHVANGAETFVDPLGIASTPPTAPGPPPVGQFPVGQTPVAGKPDNYLVISILATLFCCLPFGVVAIVQAAKVDSAWNSGQYDEARRLSGEAKKWATVSAVLGAIVIGAYLIFYAWLFNSVRSF